MMVGRIVYLQKLVWAAVLKVIDFFRGLEIELEGIDGASVYEEEALEMPPEFEEEFEDFVE